MEPRSSSDWYRKIEFLQSDNTMVRDRSGGLARSFRILIELERGVSEIMRLAEKDPPQVSDRKQLFEKLRGVLSAADPEFLWGPEDEIKGLSEKLERTGHELLLFEDALDGAIASIEKRRGNLVKKEVLEELRGIFVKVKKKVEREE